MGFILDSSELPGMFRDYAGGSAPANYLLCDGSSYLISQFPALYAALGGASSPYGSVDGFTSHFNVPDSRRRVPMGSGGTAVSGPGNTVGSIGGEETHLLSSNESGLPAHNHPPLEANFQVNASSAGNYTINAGGSGLSKANPTTGNNSTQNAANAHNNVQPSLVVTRMVRY